MRKLFYNLVLLVFFPLYLLHYIYGRFYLRKYSRSIWERFGVFKYTPTTNKEKTILVHAVSVGETVAAQPFILTLQKKYPTYALVFSNVTETGHQQAIKTISADNHVLFPLDYPSAVSNFLDRLKPTLVFILETEIWPNFLMACEKRSIPVFFINGRISNHSFERYSLFRFFIRHFIKNAVFLMQTEEDVRRIKSLGAKKVAVSGNLKYDQLPANLNSPKREELKICFQSFKLPIIIFGSTHQKETANILELIKEWKEQNLNYAHYIIAPRHLNYLTDYQAMASNLGLKSQLKSGFNADEDLDCLFLDTYGELSCLYEIANIVFIGGSLEPIGGHSILEPAIFAKPIIYGPHMENNQEICRIFEKEGAAIKIHNLSELKQRIEFLLLNDKLSLEIGQKAYKITISMTGATENIFNNQYVKSAL